MISKLKTIVYILAVIFTVSSCKDNVPSPGEPDPTKIDKSKTYLSNKYENRLKDSVWYYYKILSLWQEVIPPTNSNDIHKMDETDYLQNNYTQYFEKSENVLDYLMLLTNYNRPNRQQEKNYDWYSFIDRGGVVNAEIQETMSSGLGLSVFYLQPSPNASNKDLYIRFVEKGSSAYEANLQRGDQILSINGDSNLDYNYQSTKNFSPLLGYLNLNSISIKVKKQNGQELSTTLNQKNYNSNPIYISKTIDLNGKKVGYFVLNSFASIRSGFSPTSFYYNLESLFQEFENNGIKELIVDLRNNGGGDVETAEYFANRIAPASLTSSIMYTYKINKFLEDWGWLEEGEEFAPIRFKKRGALNLSRVYFLVSPGTASASELLINTLKPVMDTYMIGTYSINDKNQEVADKTYGKPVGFFGYAVLNDNVDLYVSSFKMYNSKGEGDYFNGLTPNTNVWEFSQFYDFGNPQETMLAAALSHIQTGSFKNLSLKASNQIKTSTYYIKQSAKIDSKQVNSGMFKFKKKDLKNN